MQPSIMRYDRVKTILGSEPVFKSQMQVLDAIVTRKDEKHHYPALVVAVTDRIHERGQDAHNAPKATVLCVATEVCELLIAKPEPVPAPAAPELSGALLNTKAKPIAPKRVRKPRPKRIPETAALPPEPVAVAEPVIHATTAVKPLKAEPYRSPATPVITPAESKVMSVYSNVSKLALTVSLQNLMQLDDDKFAGFEKRREAVDFLIGDFIKIKDIPSPVLIHA